MAPLLVIRLQRRQAARFVTRYLPDRTSKYQPSFNSAQTAVAVSGERIQGQLEVCQGRAREYRRIPSAWLDSLHISCVDKKRLEGNSYFDYRLWNAELRD